MLNQSVATRVSELAEAMRNPAPLNPELAHRIVDRGRLRLIAHPLLHTMYLPAFNGDYNKILEQKKASIEKAKRKRDWSGYVFMHERPYRVNAFLDIHAEMKDEEYWPLLGWVWTDSENIQQNRPTWQFLLRDARDLRLRHLMMDVEDRAKYDKLPEMVTVYRGCIRNKNMSGLSWTTDRATAIWFAQRVGQSGAILAVGVVDRGDVIAYFNGRNESEIVVDPRHVMNRREIKIGGVA